MAHYRTTRPCSLPPAIALTAATDPLRRLGYTLTETSASQYLYKYDGRYWAWNAANNPHKLQLAASSGVLDFDFDYGMNRGGSLEELFEERATAVVAAMPAPAHSTHQIVYVQAPVVPPVIQRELVERQIVVVRCRFCKRLVPVDASQCGECGAGNFS